MIAHSQRLDGPSASLVVVSLWLTYTENVVDRSLKPLTVYSWYEYYTWYRIKNTKTSYRSITVVYVRGTRGTRYDVVPTRGVTC